MVAVPADASCLVGVDLELVPHLVAGAAGLTDVGYLGDVDWFLGHVDHGFLGCWCTKAFGGMCFSHGVLYVFL